MHARELQARHGRCEVFAAISAVYAISCSWLPERSALIFLPPARPKKSSRYPGLRNIARRPDSHGPSKKLHICYKRARARSVWRAGRESQAHAWP